MRISPISLSSSRNNNQTYFKSNKDKCNISDSEVRYYLGKTGSATQGAVLVQGKEANKIFQCLNKQDERNKIVNDKIGLNAIIMPANDDPEFVGLRILISKDRVDKKNPRAPKDSKITSTVLPEKDFLVQITDDKQYNWSDVTSNNGAYTISMVPDSVSTTVSFGTLYGSIRKDDTNISDFHMMKQYNDFFNTGMKDKLETTYLDKKADRIKDKYNHFTPTDGDGSRFKPVSMLQGGVTKPASAFPAMMNGANMTLIQTVFANLARTGTMDDEVKFIKVKPAQGSAYALLEGLKSGKVSTEKPIVFSWGDNFSDLDITRLILKHEKENSGFTMLTIPRNKKDVSALGVIKVEDNKGIPLEDRKIQAFVEKPKDQEFIDSIVLPEISDGKEEKALAVVGPYILSREALEWIKNKYTTDPKFFHDADKGYDFSSRIIVGLLDAMEDGEIKDKKTGEPLSMYFDIKPNTEKWSDVGKREDFVDAIQDVYQGKFANMPQEMQDSISRNVDANGNIYMSDNARIKTAAFARKYNLRLENCIVYFDEKENAKAKSKI